MNHADEFAGQSSKVRQTPGPAPNWMPDLCQPRSVFGVLVAVELVVLATVLLRLPEAKLAWRQLSTASLLALWLALSCITVLCQLRRSIDPLPRSLGIGLALAVPVALVGIATWLVVLLDQELDLGFTVGAPLTARFVLACMAVALLLTAAVLRYLYVAEQWRRQVAASSQAQVEALQARIQPHFLFNSMNSIAGLIRHDPIAAEHAVEDLAELFRAALGSGRGDSTLEEELHLTRRYLAIEALRLGERLRVTWDIAPDLPMQLDLPRLLLQPLAENAINHGIAKCPEGGELHIRVRRAGDELHIEVRNPLVASGSSTHGNRHAQESIAQRLAHRFGARARMAADARDGYYAATLVVPIDAP